MFATAHIHTHKKPALPKRRSFLNLLSAACLAAGILMFGQSAWIEAKAILAQALLERAFSDSIILGRPVKAWSWADTVPVARIEVPRLKAGAIVLKGASGEALAFGPALLNETALPGAPGTSVIAAHRDTHFDFLKDVVTGDTIRITRNDGLTFTYRVTGYRIVEWDKSGIDRHAAGFHLVLSTCYPFDAVARGTQRYLVEAEMLK